VSCDITSIKECTQAELAPGGVSAAQQGCMTGGGTVGTGCPTTGLGGCCQLSPTNETCYYTAATAALSLDQMSCSQSHGTWSKTP